MNILFYKKLALHSGGLVGGPFMVACDLSKALSNEVAITYYPSYVPRSYASNILKVYSGLARRDFRLIHFILAPCWNDGSYSLLAFAKMTGATTIVNIHGVSQVEYMLDYPDTRKNRSILYRGVATVLRSCKQADKIVTFSEFMRNQIMNWYGVRREKIAVIPNGVDLERFSKPTSKQRLDGDPAILYFGYLSRLKGVDLLINAISRLEKKLPNLKLHLVGHSGDMASFELLAKKEHVEKAVVFHGYADPETAAGYYKSADFCVFPGRWNFGLTLLEAMASGTPVITSNRGGTQEIISDGEDGLLFEPDDADALPKSILALSQDSDLRKRLSSKALKTVANYSWENIASKYLSLYEDLIK